MKEKSYSYTIQVLSPTEKDMLESYFGNVKLHSPFGAYGIELFWIGRVKMTEADLLVFKLKFPEIEISRTYLSKEKRFLENKRQLEKFGIEIRPMKI
jgi:hypothetical protein